MSVLALLSFTGLYVKVLQVLAQLFVQELIFGNRLQALLVKDLLHFNTIFKLCFKGELLGAGLQSVGLWILQVATLNVLTCL